MSEADADIHDERNQRWDQPFGDEPLGAETIVRVLSLPLFAGVDRDEFPAWLPLELIIANDGRLRSYQRGDVIIRKGDYGSSSFAVLEGSVVGLTGPAADQVGAGPADNRRKSWSRSLAQLFNRTRIPEYRRRRRRWLRQRSVPASPPVDPQGLGCVDLDQMAAGHSTFAPSSPLIFGELGALAGTPRSASIVAAEDNTLVFELRWQGLRDIRHWSGPFRQRTEELYRERGMRSAFEACLVFRHVDDHALDEIVRHSLFENYGNVDWMHRFKRDIGRERDTGHIIEQEPVICEQGHHVDGLLIILRGFARVTERVDHGERTIGHLAHYDVFGLDEIARIDRGEVGVTLKTGLRAVGYLDVIRVPTSLVRKYVLPGLPGRFLRDPDRQEGRADEDLRQGMMDFVVDHRFINGANAMVINLDRCVGCDDCVRACATAHDNNPRFLRHGYSYENAMIANACMHCIDPVCLIGCPTGAIHREQDSGIVVIDDATCIGCATCANACPYNNIKMVDIRDDTGAFLLDKEGLTISRATKCDFCASQLTGPACAQACPHDALIRVDIRDTKKLMAWLG